MEYSTQEHFFLMKKCEGFEKMVCFFIFSKNPNRYIEEEKARQCMIVTAVSEASLFYIFNL